MEYITVTHIYIIPLLASAAHCMVPLVNLLITNSIIPISIEIIIEIPIIKSAFLLLIFFGYNI